ncbi:NXPE family member 3-like [Mercenaria mercenaria]|uniref:NXPE family member 3-like n=1 Tax=Mercenaria mercenaria TaxID=6596 RepID=UPI00234EC8B7|nr:NXPE family member 3-like [Mercenaria mercenaria]
MKMECIRIKARVSIQYSRIAILGVCLILAWLTLEDLFDIRIRLHEMFPDRHVTTSDPVIVYAPCTRIPSSPKGTLWPEEKYIHDVEVQHILDLADPLNSRVWIEGGSVRKVGDTVNVKILLYDGHGYRKKTGGDLIRAWMKEPSLGASSTAKVIDNKDGSYSAVLKAFWVGQPEIVAAIISPREVIATAFKRRYMCPPVLMNSAIFTHPSEPSIVEETPCNYVNQVPGYSELCNFTQENYGRPWFCGKPRHARLLCHDWTMVADQNLWNKGLEKQALSEIAYELMTLNYSARKIDSSLKLTVVKGAKNQSVFVPTNRCGKVSKASSWELASPSGFFYEHSWTNKHCRTTFSPSKLESCLRNTKLILIGDSTTRQMFSKIETLVSCQWITDTWSTSGKHRPAICVNSNLNFSLTWELHPLPFCTRNTPRHYLKSFSAYLNEIQDQSKTVIVLHMYAHVLNHHSHVFFETLKDMKKGIIGLLDRNKNAQVIIKGPHAYSFSRSSDHVIWMPDAYADIYQTFIYNEFKDINDRVIYLESLDMTVSSEQWHIHAEDYIIHAFAEQIFNRVCTSY